MRICADCGSDVPVTNADCPYCGAPAPTSGAAPAPVTISLAERYGPGTAPVDGAPAGDAGTDPAASSRRRWRRPVMIGGAAVALVAALLVLGAGTGFLSFGQAGNSGPSAAAPTATPGPTGPSPAQVLGAFSRLAGRRDLAYHVESSGTTTSGGKSRSFTGSLDVAGADYEGTLTSKGAGATGTTRIAYVDGVLYTKAGSKPWARRATADERYLQWPFLGLSGPYDLAPAGTTQREGETLIVLRSTSNYHPSRERMLSLAAIKPATDLLVLEVYVRETGQPVAASFRLEAGGVDKAGNPVFSGTANWVFTRIGETITIEAPSK